LTPVENEYLYFVSDVTGKKYFAATNTEHEANIVRVQQINRSLGTP